MYMDEVMYNFAMSIKVVGCTNLDVFNT